MSQIIVQAEKQLTIFHQKLYALNYALYALLCSICSILKVWVTNKES